MARTRSRFAVVSGGAVALAVLAAAPAPATPRPASATAPLIANGSFEINPYNATSYVVLDGDGFGGQVAGWTLLRGQADLVTTYWPAAEGSQSMELSGYTETSAIAQDVTTIPGHPYRVDYELSGNPTCAPQTKQVVVTFGKAAPVQTYDVVAHGTTVTNMHWQSISDTFVATATTTQLSFDNPDPAATPCGPVIDAVSVTDATPPPTSLAEVPVPAVLALAGMLTIAGAAASRRRRAQVS